MNKALVRMVCLELAFRSIGMACFNTTVGIVGNILGIKYVDKIENLVGLSGLE